MSVPVSTPELTSPRASLASSTPQGSEPRNTLRLAEALQKWTRLEAAERLQFIREAARILAEVSQDKMSIGRIGVECDRLEADVAAISKGESAGDKAGRVAASLTAIEETVLEIDATVPMGSFRDSPTLRAAKPASLARYAGLLARHIGEDPERRDRIDYLAAALISPRNPDGRRALRDRAEVDLSLKAISGGRLCPPEQRRAEVAAFSAAKASVEKMAKPEELFTTGLYAELYAYKTTLRETFLDPDILYASSAYAASVANLMARSTPQAAAQLASKLKGAQAEALVALKGLDETPTGGELHERSFRPQFERSRQEKRSTAVRKVRTAPLPRETSWPGIALRIAALVIIAVGGFFFWRGQIQGGARILTPEETRHLAPWLLTGAVSGDPPRRAFIGAVSSQRWNSWNAERRVRIIRTFQRKLANYLDTNDALIQMDQVPVLMIQEGKVVFSK